MARNRMIKPDFWNDEKISKLSFVARLLYIGMWNQSDDYAVVKGNHNWLKAKIFPYDDIKDFDKYIQEILNQKFIIPFQTNEENYYFIKNFCKHQTINRPSKDYRNPPVPESLIEHSLSSNGIGIDEDKISKDKIIKVNISFNNFWDLYQKKVGDKMKLEKKWNNLKDDERELIMVYVPEYVLNTPDKKYRKNPETFLNQRAWENEIIKSFNSTEQTETLDSLANKLINEHWKRFLNPVWKGSTHREMARNISDKLPDDNKHKDTPDLINSLACRLERKLMEDITKIKQPVF